MPATYEPIATTTLGTAVNSFTFSSIPGTYTDLVLTVVVPTAASSATFGLRFNSSSNADYSHTTLTADGTTATSYNGSSQNIFVAGDMFSTANVVSFMKYNIFSYAGSKNKTILAENSGDTNSTNGVVRRTVGLWRSTAAITSVTVIKTSAGNFPINTVATLYGILKA